jgi:DNA-binding PadR family transcriptional regulator
VLTSLVRARWRMSRRLTTTSCAVPGLLSISPMSGYELHQAVARSIARFWPISKSQVYAGLGRLEPLGMVEGTEVPQQRLPTSGCSGGPRRGRRPWMGGWLTSRLGRCR